MKRAIVEYDYIRAVAVLLVVLGHCTYYKIVTLNGGIDYGINSEQSMVGKILSLITLTLYAFHMPLFIALSGSLWAVIIQDKGTPTFKSLIKNKANRLLLPFLFVTLFWSMPLKYLSGYWHGSFQEIACQIFLGQILMFGSYNSHLWFLQALFFIFILAYFVEKFNLRDYKILFFTILLLISLIAKYIESSHHICFLNIQTAFVYFVWFYVGFFFEKKRILINSYIKEYIGWRILLIIWIVYPVMVFCNTKLPHNLCYFSYYPLAIIGISLTYIVCYKSLLITPVRYMKYIKQISANSYGLYLYSDPINYVIIYFISVYSLSDLFVFNSFTIFIYIISFLMSIAGAWVIINIIRRCKGFK